MSNPESVSACCGAELKVISGDEGTNFYTCSSCLEPADPKPQSNEETICSCGIRGCGKHRPMSGLDVIVDNAQQEVCKLMEIVVELEKALEKAEAENDRLLNLITRYGLKHEPSCTIRHGRGKKCSCGLDNKLVVLKGSGI